MESFILPTEKVVKRDADSFAHPNCPVCKSDKMNFQLSGDNSMMIYCNTDNVSFRFSQGKLWQIDIQIYDLDMLYYAENQNKKLRFLLINGLITYVTYLRAVKLSNSKLPENV